MTTSTDDSVAHRRRLLQRAAWLCALLVLVVTKVVSAGDVAFSHSR